MNLCEGEKGSTYLVSDVALPDDIARRLAALGVNENTPVTVQNKKKNGTLIMKVRGTRLALGRQIGEGIEIKELQTMQALEKKDRKGEKLHD